MTSTEHPEHGIFDNPGRRHRLPGTEKAAESHGHFKTYCRQCGTVMGQCRCTSKDKEKRYGLCKACGGKDWDMGVKESAAPIVDPNQGRIFNPAGLPMPVPAAILASSTLLGSLLSQDQGRPITDKIRGGFKGLSAGAGGLAGVLLSDSLQGGGLGGVAGAGGGALVGLLAAERLSKMLGLEKKPVVGYGDELSELLGKKVN